MPPAASNSAGRWAWTRRPWRAASIRWPAWRPGRCRAGRRRSGSRRARASRTTRCGRRANGWRRAARPWRKLPNPASRHWRPWPPAEGGCSTTQHQTRGIIMKAIIRMLSIAVLSVAAAGAQAGAYPDRPIRLVVPFPPGGTTDLLGRVFAERLADSLGRQVVVENRPGAGGVIGSDVVAKAPADGYTLLFGTVGTQSINGSLYKQLPFDIDKDFTPLGLFAGVPNILVVNPAVPARNVQE